jgi:histidyl-tRNA synthetase
VPAVIRRVFSELAIGPFTIQLNNRKLMRGWFEGSALPRAKQMAWCCARSTSSTSAAWMLCARTLCGRGLQPGDRRWSDASSRSSSCVRHRTPMRWRSSTALGGGNALLRAGSSTNCARCCGWSRLRRAGIQLRSILSIARGLDYYTGTVYETTLTEHPQIGSICSGGRYENLAGHYTKSKLPGVGISIGATRLFFQLRERG